MLPSTIIIQSMGNVVKPFDGIVDKSSLYLSKRIASAVLHEFCSVLWIDFCCDSIHINS